MKQVSPSMLSTSSKMRIHCGKGLGVINEEFFKKALPNKNYATYLAESNRLAAHRKIVATRIFEIVALAGAPPKGTP
jgi:hypothetical protein